MRNLLLVLVLFLLVVIPFLVWGEWFSAMFSDQAAIETLEAYGNWAWGIGILLLMGDLFLPLPATVIMSALGFIYGPVLGGFIAALGSFFSGLLAYILCRTLGQKVALYILGEKDLEKGGRIFARSGGWMVAVSRWLPVFPEVIACMAGLHQMNWRKFTIALFCGSLPLGFVFAYIGFAGTEAPFFALIVSAVLPVFLWLIAQYLLRRLSRPLVDQ